LKPLLYVSAGSVKMGMGHLLRSEQVVDILRKKGLDLRTVALIPDGAISSLSPLLDCYEFRRNSLQDIGVHDVDAAVVDVDVNIQAYLLPWLQEKGLRTFALDWYTETGNVVVKRINLRDGISALRYCIVRNDFHCAAKKRIGIAPKYDAVVVLGSGDIRGYLPAFMSCFQKERVFLDRKIAVIIGPLVDSSQCEPVADQKNLIIEKNPKNLAELMANAYLGITNGGTTLMEFTMLGVPTVIFPQTEREATFVAPFVKLGCGLLGSMKKDEYIPQLRMLWANKILRQQMSESCLKTIDGLGASRVAEEIQVFLGER